MDEFEVVRRLGQRLDHAEPDRRKPDAWERIRALAEREARGEKVGPARAREAWPNHRTVERDEASERIRRAAERGLEPRDSWPAERSPSRLEPDEEWFGRDRGDRGIDR
jgi:hypothetical protein